MKKVLLVVMMTVLGSAAVAQGSFSVGIKGGVNLSELKTGDFLVTRLNANGSPQVDFNGREIRDNLRNSFETRTGWAYGAYARFGRNLYLQPELLVSGKRGSFDIVRNVNGKPTTETVTVKTTYLDVPILLGLKGGPLRIMGGPIVSFRMSDDQRVREALREYTSGSLNEAFSKAVYGYQFGAGLDLGRLGIDVRREGSLSDVAAVNLGSDASQQQFNQKIKSWQVTLAYRLF